MSSGPKKIFTAVDCAGKAGKYAFGLDEAKTVSLLRKLADDLEAGNVVLQSVTTSNHASHEEFAVKEYVIEVLEELPGLGLQVVKPVTD
jgi:hypothetical protein